MRALARNGRVLLVLYALVGCGGRASEKAATSTAAGGNPGDAEAGSNSGGDGVAGSPCPTSCPDGACGTAEPLLGPDSGLERCSRGYVRRVGPAHCSSSVPRSAGVPAYNPEIDDCHFDADCSTATYGPHAHCDVRQRGFAHTCVSGCTVDAECAADEVCLCGDPVGRCVASTCRSASDCGGGWDCAVATELPLCFSQRLSCQSDADECQSDSDCAGRFINAAFCVYGERGRSCQTLQCTTP